MLWPATQFFLATGHTIQYKSIKSDTMKQYLIAASGLIQLFDIVERDARKVIGDTQICRTVAKVILAVIRFEDVPARQEPYPTAMPRRYVECSHFHHRDSSHASLTNWFGVAIQRGNRRYKWCQSVNGGTLGSEELNPKGKKIAFTRSNITFLGKGKVQLSWDTALANPKTVFHVQVRYRW